jgi:hypothetical protein
MCAEAGVTQGGGGGRLLVTLLDWVLGDGAVPPPATGDRVRWALTFRDADHVPPPICQSSTVVAVPRGVPVAAHGSTGHVWPTRLVGPGWEASWWAPQPYDGPVRVTGALFVDTSGTRDRAVTGTITEAHVISEELDGGHVVAGSVQLRPVTTTSRWLDRGPEPVLRDLPPAGSGTLVDGHRYVFLGNDHVEPSPPHRRETGVLVTLALDGVAGRP